MELTETEIELCLYLKKYGFFDTKSANAIVSFNSDGSEVKLKFEAMYRKPPFSRRNLTNP